MFGSEKISLQDALAALADKKMPILAGGTDFYPGLMDGPAPYPVLDITLISGLKTLEKMNSDWRIGAAVTWTQVVKAELPPAFAGLRAAALEVGSLQIQNSGTVVGNICNASPAADGVPPLIALNARVEISSASNVRVVPIEQFILGVRDTALEPDEIVTALLVPEFPKGTISRFKKLGTRSYLVISIAMIAVTLEISDAGIISNVRIAVGACSAVAQRLFALEEELAGLKISKIALSGSVRMDHLFGLSPIDDVRGSGGFRMEAVREMLTRMLVDCANDGGPS